jgi:acyl carrier protein
MEDRIKDVMAVVFEIDRSQIDENCSPDIVENWDSLRHMNMIVALEEEFQIRFSDEDIPNMTNFKIIRNIILEEGKK